jgi:hypothetical protein
MTSFRARNRPDGPEFWCENRSFYTVQGHLAGQNRPVLRLGSAAMGSCFAPNLVIDSHHAAGNPLDDRNRDTVAELPIPGAARLSCGPVVVVALESLALALGEAPNNAGHFHHVVKLVGVGEVPCADGGCGLVDFHGGNGFRPGALKSEAKPTYPVK